MLSLHEKMNLLCGAFGVLSQNYAGLGADNIPKSVVSAIDSVSKQIEELANEIIKAQVIKVTEVN